MARGCSAAAVGAFVETRRQQGMHRHVSDDGPLSRWTAWRAKGLAGGGYVAVSAIVKCSSKDEQHKTAGSEVMVAAGRAAASSASSSPSSPCPPP